MSFTGIIKIAKGFAILFATLISIFFIIVAPIELAEVNRAKTVDTIDAVFEKIEYRVAPFRKSQKYLVLKFRTFVGKNIEIVDQRPGDIPFTIDFIGLIVFDTNRDVVDTLHMGKVYKIIPTNNAKKYYLEPGDSSLMIVLLIASGLWLSFISIMLFQAKNGNISNPIRGEIKS